MQADDTLEQQLAAAVGAYETGELDQALEMTRRLCTNYPDVAIVHNVHGVVAAGRGDLEVAIDSYRRAIELEPGNYDVHFNLGNVLRDMGDLNGALASYRLALHYRPNDGDVLFNLAGVLRRTGDLRSAAEIFQELVNASPEDPAAHNNLGGVLFRLGKSDAATRCFRRALELQPQYVTAHDNLCEVLEKTNQTDELRKAVTAAQAHCPPNNIRIAIRRAQLLRRDDEPDKARKVLGKVIRFHPAQPQLNSAYWYLMGDICDRLRDQKAGYDAFVEANKWAAKAAAERNLQPQDFIKRLENLQTAYRSVRRKPQQQATGAAGAPQLVFLIGFPRSGTTLLDTVLLSHSRISVVEEKPMVQDMVRLARGWQAGQTLNHEELTGEQIQELRDAYMTRLFEYLPGDVAEDQVVIDKLPLNIVEAGLISKVFPQAGFLLVLRHPCDCVLSCFMQDFRLNNAMSNFLDLKSAAHCYDKVMSLWTVYREALPLKLHTVKYEQVVADLQGTVSQVLEFLGLDWEEAMADYRATALDRKRIGTPSYHQVVQPVYNRARDRWRLYRAHMIPVLPTLLRWAAIYGYTEGAGKGSDNGTTTEPGAIDDAK